MVIQKGYKRTDSGIIPEDWKISSLNDCLELLTDFEANGSFESVADNVNIYDIENYAWYVRATDLEKKSELSNVKFVDEGTYNFLKKTSLKGGEVLITKRGEIGKVYFFQMKTRYATVAPNMYLLNLNKSVVPFYIYSFFKAEIGNKLLKEKNASSTLGALYKDDVKSIQIPLPPTLVEQTAIATALSDADSLITGLEKLIAKKRNIKQGTMQQLLQPKEGWKVKKLGEVSEIYTGKKNNQDKVENGKYPFFVRSKTIETINSYSFDGEAILIPGEGNIGSIFHYINGKFDYHQRVYKISHFNDKYSGKYIYRYITEHFGKHAMQNSVKATVDSLRLPTFQVFEIPFPPTKEEQTRIASILSDMDAELTALEQKLEKYKKIKLGMMQELLTGKTRLV